MTPSPAFQFYPDDFLGSSKVASMAPAEVGIYVYLLCLDWNDTGFVLAPKRLSRICRVTEAEFVEAWAVLIECFVEREGRWYNPRLERERVKQAAYSAKQKAASDIRWESHRNATGMPRDIPRVSSPFPSPALATTGGRKRPGTANVDNYAPGHANLPTPPECLPDCGFKTPEGQKRPVRVHAEGCANA